MQLIQSVLQKAANTVARLIGAEPETHPGLQRHTLLLFSAHLGREVTVTLLLPPAYTKDKNAWFPLLLLNDGQDIPSLQLEKTLEQLFDNRAVRPFITAGVHCNHDRMQEYGVSGRPDYRQRGSKAGAHAAFVTGELLPYLRSHYRCLSAPSHNVIAGFSLGGLSAFDIAWRHPQYFSKTGVFSGSFWWRSQPFSPDDPDGNRILHEELGNSSKREGMRFWLQAGTRDETSDRNHNGIIDAIDDTLDVIAGLKKLGYADADIRYVQVEGGEHNPHTWGQIMPDFLRWAFSDGASLKIDVRRLPD